VEPLDLALGLWVGRAPVALGDSEVAQQGLEGVAAAGEAGCAGGSVVGEGGGRRAVCGDRGQERGDDGGACDPGRGGAAQQQVGVVVEEVEDLRVGPVGQGPVGEVRLAALVSLGGPDRR
jgi:hypothetical protein